MPLADSAARLPADRAADMAYINEAFVPRDPSTRALVERGILPRATYVWPDGTPMVPRDHAALLEDAGGDPEAIGGRFHERFVAAGGDPAAADDEHASWLSGEYGACLHSTSPEAIVAKSALMTAIAAFLVAPAPTHVGARR